MTIKRQIITRNNAKLTSAQIAEDDVTVFNSLIRGIPETARKDFKELKRMGKISGSMNAFIVNAFIEKLDSMK